MSKSDATTKIPRNSLSSETASTLPDAAIKQAFWLLNTGTAKKLGKQSEGGISYVCLSPLAPIPSHEELT